MIGGSVEISSVGSVEADATFTYKILEQFFKRVCIIITSYVRMNDTHGRIFCTCMSLMLIDVIGMDLHVTK